MIDLFISLHDKCNWKCAYCDNHRLDQNINEGNIKQFFNLLKNFNLQKYNLNLEGGEIGLTPNHILDYIFKLDYTYNVSTNGKFLELDYHNKYENLNEIYYHCLPDFKDDSTFRKYNYKKLYYVMVITPENLQYLDKFLDLHNDVIFSPQLLQPRDANVILTRKYFEDVYKIIKNKNVIENFINRIEKILNIDEQQLRTKRKICAINYNNILINLKNNKIHRCCISSFTDSVNLNKENLTKLFHNKKMFSKIEDRCNYCNASYIFDTYKF